MKFLVDAQLPPALARWLEAQGHVAQHVVDLGLDAETDRNIWKVAQQSDSVIVTKDEDFAILSAVEEVDRRLSGSASATLHVGRC